MVVIKQRYVLTVATGKKVYVDMAVNLARSFLHWHPESDIRFQLVTDRHDMIPDNVRSAIDIIPIKQDELGKGFSVKLHLDKLISPGQTLFIDSDCLIFEPLDHVFDRFRGHDVSVVGTYITEGEWFGDVGTIRQKFDLDRLPKFNGGLYYLERTERTAQIYTLARKLEKEYDNIGFIRLREQPNDEVLMALTMQLHGQKPVVDDGTIMSDPLAFSGRYHINVISGERWLSDAGTRISPSVIHFLGSFTEHYPYRREVFRLERFHQQGLGIVQEIRALLRIQYPAQFKLFLKNRLRPVYRFFFGFRKVKRSERIA